MRQSIIPPDSVYVRAEQQFYRQSVYLKAVPQSLHRQLIKEFHKFADVYSPRLCRAKINKIDLLKIIKHAENSAEAVAGEETDKILIDYQPDDVKHIQNT